MGLGNKADHGSVADAEADAVLSDTELSDAVLADDRAVLTLLESGRVVEANHLFEQLIAAPPTDTDRVTRASTLIFRAIAGWRLGRTPLALELAAEGWTELDAGPLEGVAAAQAFGRLGYLLDAIGRRGEALQLSRRSVQLARACGDPDTLAHCLQRLGGGLNLIAADADPAQQPEIFAEARKHLEEGLELTDDPRVHRSLLGARARALAGLGELQRAEELATRTIELSEGVDSWGLCIGRWVLAAVRRSQQEPAAARALLLQAAHAAEQVEDTALMQVVGIDLAAVGRELGDAATEVAALRYVLAANQRSADTLREGLGQALEQRRFAVRAQRLALAAQQAAARDPLTGLGNRLGLEQSASMLLNAAIATNRVVWLLLLDVDHFKDVNDVAGHPAGDAVLRQIAKLLRQECRTGDLVARWAGDEFVVLLAAELGDHRAGPSVAERIRAAVADNDWSLAGASPTGVDGLRPTVSLGVATGRPDLDVLFTLADAALYRAKRLGRNRVEVHGEPAAQPTSPAR